MLWFTIGVSLLIVSCYKIYAEGFEKNRWLLIIALIALVYAGMRHMMWKRIERKRKAKEES